MTRDPFIAKLVKRHSELKAIVDHYFRVIDEFQELELTITKLRRLFPDDFEDVGLGTSPAVSDGQSPVVTVGRPPTMTVSPATPQLIRFPSGPKLSMAVLAQDILQSELALHANELLRALREKGWIGSGDDKKDIRNIASTLGLKPEIFHNYGQNTWGLKSRVQAEKEVPGR